MALIWASYIGALIILCLPVLGQDETLEEILTDQLTAQLENPTNEDVADQQFFLHELLILDINKASNTELNSIPVLTSLQVQTLRNYMQQNGPLISIYELQAVPGWDLTTIRLIEPMIQVRERSTYYDPRKLGEKLRQDGGVEFMIRVKQRLELSKGFKLTDSRAFVGSPVYFQSRLQYRKKADISFGLTTEKDPGEKFGWDLAKKHFGTDYMSMHLQIENRGIVKRMIVGDFKAQWDQGLLLSSGLSLGRQALTRPRKIHRGLLPHTGTAENSHFRGLGLEITIGTTTVSSLFSINSIDARILPEDLKSGQPERVTSIIESGLHRTVTEIDRRQVLRERIIGWHIRRSTHKHLSYSISGVYRDWPLPLIPTASKHEKFRFAGKRNYNFSSSFEYVWKNMNCFGQVAFSRSGGWSGLLGLVTSFSPAISMTLHFRNYGKSYHGILNNAFGSKPDNSNEQGIYWGIQVTPNKRWLMEYYNNMYRFPWFTNHADAPSQGMEQLARVEYAPTKRSRLDLYWRVRTRQVNKGALSPKLTHDIAGETKQNVGIKAMWEGNGRITAQTRVQYSRNSLDASSTEGVLASNQVSYAGDFLRITASMAIFDTDDFANRHYIYERDLPYSLSIPFFDGAGIRWYWLTRLRINKNCHFWLRIAHTKYRDRNHIGSGSDRINGSKKTDISLQFKMKL